MDEETLKQVFGKIVKKELLEEIVGSLAEGWFNDGKVRGVKIGIEIGEARGAYANSIKTAKQLLLMETFTISQIADVRVWKSKKSA
jgi:hypothetical protein